MDKVRPEYLSCATSPIYGLLNVGFCLPLQLSRIDVKGPEYCIKLRCNAVFRPHFSLNTTSAIRVSSSTVPTYVKIR